MPWTPVMASLGLVVGAMQLAGRVPLPGDAGVYWRPVMAAAQYVYPPVLAQAISPLRALDAWQAFTVLWSGLCFGALGLCAGPWALPLAGAGLLPLGAGPLADAVQGPAAAAFIGNVTLPMAACIVLGLSGRPSAWAVPLLTKMTPGVGVLWHLFRGERRAFAVALGATLAVVGVSALADPSWWPAFLGFAAAHAGDTSSGPPIVGPPSWVRLPIAVLLVAWAARADRPRLVPLACAVAVLGLYGPGTLSGVAVGALSPRLRTGR